MQRSRQTWSAGVTLVEMMVTLVIGAFMMIGVVSIFAQSRTAYRVNDTMARMQENVRFALATMQPDIRLAQNWGMTNDGANVTRAAGVTARCPDNTNVTNWAVPADLAPVGVPPGIEATNGVWPAALLCPAFGNAFQPGSDVLVVRHASAAPVAAANNVIQIQTNRTTGTVFNNGAAPLAGACVLPSLVCIYNWQTHAYYVSSTSSLGPNVPSLRRKTLVNGVVQDQELIPGVEDFQVQFGVDTDDTDNIDQVARYVDADSPIITPGAAGFIATAKVLTVHIWLMFRAEQPETGFLDGATYNYADVVDYAPDDGFRRALVNKTIVLRNARG